MIIKRFLSRSLCYLNKNQLSKRPILSKQADKSDSSISQFFVDYKVTNVRGGKGGDGIVSFMHTKEKEFAGPDGGDGGHGGSVVFKACLNVKSLNKLQSIYNADDGVDGMGYHKRGKNGQNLIIKVPIGTSLVSLDGKINSELRQNDASFIAVRGGPGGKGNAYYLSNENRYPTHFELGKPGEEISFHAQLNIIADAALLGFPNVGKSSVLRALTNARPKIGNYAFTTLHPHVGVVDYADFLQISIVDFPGILPDLSKGFGTRFFHHLDECKIFLFVVDMSCDEPSPYEQFEATRKALELYNEKIFENKSVMVLGNKVDLVNENLAERIADFKKNTYLPIIPLSIHKKINLNKFLTILRDTIETNKAD